MENKSGTAAKLSLFAEDGSVGFPVHGLDFLSSTQHTANMGFCWPNSRLAQIGFLGCKATHMA
jgi:hypothetical protein